MSKETTFQEIQNDFLKYLYKHGLGNRIRWTWRNIILGKENYKILLQCQMHTDLSVLAATRQENDYFTADKLVQAYNKFLFFKPIL